MTERNDSASPRGEFFYDAGCEFCIRWANRIRGLLERRGVAVVPFENGAEELEMKLHWHDGRVFGGADAAVFLAGNIWWAWPMRAAAAIPGVRPLLRAGYRRIAANRHCRTGACRLPKPNRHNTHAGFGWGLLGALIAVAWIAGTAIPTQPCWFGDLTLLNRIPAWLWMWLMAGALWIGFKVIAWLRAGAWPALGKRTFAFAGWIGMDAAAFRKRVPARHLPWIGGAIATVLGAILLGGLIPNFDHPVLRGWLGMTAFLLLLHFGTFELLGAFWNRAGFPVRPIMEKPWKARSLTEFWSERWNRAFSDVASGAVFRPLVRRFGVAAGTVAGFIFSGLAHELVISIPAGAGFGLPTLYFLIQGLGVLAERRLGFRGKPIGRWWTFAVVLAPAFWLFHPSFMKNVMDPFLTFITP